MVWLLIAIFVYAMVSIAWGDNSRHLDGLETRRRVVMTIQLFNVPPDIVKDTEFTVDVTSEAIHNIPVESLDSLSVRNEDETCVRSPAADDRGFNHGMRPVPGEAELHEVYADMPPGPREFAIIPTHHL